MKVCMYVFFENLHCSWGALKPPKCCVCKVVLSVSWQHSFSLLVQPVAGEARLMERGTRNRLCTHRHHGSAEWVDMHVLGDKKWINYKGNQNLSVVEKLLTFVKLESYCGRPTNQHFWWGLVFLWSSTSSPGGVPWLHGYGKNARSVTKY